MGRGITALLGAVVALVLLGGAPAGAQDTLNCGDFPTREAAQAQLDADPSDPHQLDGNDDDGRACEDTTYTASDPAPTGADEDGAVPSGGVDTGAGGLADGQDDATVRWLWVVSVPLIGGIIFLATRSVAGGTTITAFNGNRIGNRNGRRRR